MGATVIAVPQPLESFLGTSTPTPRSQFPQGCIEKAGPAPRAHPRPHLAEKGLSAAAASAAQANDARRLRVAGPGGSEEGAGCEFRAPGS